MPVLISILCAATVFLFILGLTRAGESAIRSERLGIPMAVDMETSLWQRLVIPLWNKLSDFVARFIPSTAMKATAAELERAGMSISSAAFVVCRIVSFVVLPALAFFACRSLSIQTPQFQLIVAMAFIAGILLPKAVVSRKIAERQRQIFRVLPDAIDLLVVCVEAGLGLDGAMDQVVQRMSGPVAAEFKRTLDDIAIGTGRMDALRNTSQRVGLQQLSIFVAALYQAEQLGVSIVDVLREQSDSMRVQRNLRAREEAATLPLKMIFPMVVCILPSMFVVLLAPAMIKLMNALQIAP
ncbi:MAG: type II secretion system F family protein [Armatimonadetes bacterium]|nr:type II secretion system F family protein [Armatimonadota bacterium]